MKKLGDLMKELGFNPDSPISAQEAFVKHLIRDAYGVDVQTPTEKSAEIRNRVPLKTKVAEPKVSSQLSFDIRDLVPGTEVADPTRKRTGTS
jgi:hypothetical protein